MRDLVFKLIIGAAALLLAVMGVFAAVGFACLSLYLYLSPFMSAALAALATASAGLLFALVVAFLARVLTRRPARANASDQGGGFRVLEEALKLGRTLGLDSRAYMSAHLPKASIVLFGIGFAIGVSPRLRKLISELLLR